ncbi:hypothetical protein MESS4_210063 [Mesorhizobium sp. STM 4661]|nr:hypothetical protein MESS4_210063 [Mesorhizobium sp. STM 4661]
MFGETAALLNAKRPARKKERSDEGSATLCWRPFTPPSALPGISPARGEIDNLTAPRRFQRWRLAKVRMTADLPPCGQGCPVGQRGGTVPPASPKISNPPQRFKGITDAREC